MQSFRGILGIVLSVLGLFLLTGCPNTSVMRGPRTTKKGKSQVGVGINYMGTMFQAKVDDQNKASGNIPLGQPTIEAAYSYGVTDFMDVQFRLNNWLYLGAGMGFQLVKSSLFDLSLALELGGTWLRIENAGISYLNIPIYLLGGLNFSKYVTLIFGGGYEAYYIYGGVNQQQSASIFAHLMLATIGFSFNFSKVSLRPLLTMTMPINQNDYFKALLWNAGLSLHFHF